MLPSMFYMQSIYKLVIGYHEIEGTKVTLKKPLVVLKKVKGADDMEVDTVATGDPTLSTSAPVEMHVAGIIRHKLLFKNRPKALISSKPDFINTVCILSRKRESVLSFTSNISICFSWSFTTSPCGGFCNFCKSTHGNVIESYCLLANLP